MVLIGFILNVLILNILDKLKKYSNPPAERSGPGRLPSVITYQQSSLLLARERDYPFIVNSSPPRNRSHTLEMYELLNELPGPVYVFPHPKSSLNFRRSCILGPDPDLI